MFKGRRRAVLLALVLIICIDVFATALYFGARILVEETMRNSLTAQAEMVGLLYSRIGEDALSELAEDDLFHELFILDAEDNVVFSTNPDIELNYPRLVLQTDRIEIEQARAGRTSAGFPYFGEDRFRQRAYYGYGESGQVLGLAAALPMFSTLEQLARIYWAWILLSLALVLVMTYIYFQALKEIELERARAERGERFEMVSRMAATVAHEIRNPLNIMSASIELRRNELEDISETDQELLMLEDLAEECSRLETVVQGFLDLSRDQALNSGQVEINAVIERATNGEEKRLLAAGQGVMEMNLKFDANVGLIQADEHRLLQMISNLLRNATDACGAGGNIRIETKALGTKEVSLSIEDSGPGIEESERERIFDPFFTRKRDGSGIGLAVVKNTVELHSGTITVDKSNTLGGALFRIVLPRKMRKPAPKQPDGKE